MPTKKPKKKVEDFIAGVELFANMVSTLTGNEIFDRKSHARSGETIHKISLRPTATGMPATKAAKFAQRLAWHFNAFAYPTHYERYDSLACAYKRGEGFFIIEGRI